MNGGVGNRFGAKWLNGTFKKRCGGGDPKFNRMFQLLSSIAETVSKNPFEDILKGKNVPQ